MYIYESGHGLGEEVQFNDVRYNPPQISTGIINEVTFYSNPERVYSYIVLVGSARVEVYIENSQIIG